MEHMISKLQTPFTHIGSSSTQRLLTPTTHALIVEVVAWH